MFDHGFKIDGCSFHYAHTWSKSGILICWRHLVTLKESLNLISFYWKRPTLHHTTLQHVLSYRLVYVPWDISSWKKIYFISKQILKMQSYIFLCVKFKITSLTPWRKTVLRVFFSSMILIPLFSRDSEGRHRFLMYNPDAHMGPQPGTGWY